jgi:sarcosine oxidase
MRRWIFEGMCGHSQIGKIFWIFLLLNICLSTGKDNFMTTASHHHFDAVVVGLGGVGTFALRALVKEGRGTGRFLGVEKACLFPLPLSSSSTTTTTSTSTTAGHSSQGRTRIYRRAYFEHAHYVPWIEHSLNVFRELQKTTGVSLMQECGTLLMEPTATQCRRATTNRFSPSTLPPLLAASWSSAQEHAIDVEYLNPSDLLDRFPQFDHSRPTNDPRMIVGLLEPSGGFLRPERIMTAALQEAMSSCTLSRQSLDNASSSSSSTTSDTNDGTVLVWDEACVANMIHGNADGPIELHIRRTQLDDEKGRAISKDTVVTTDKVLVSAGAWTADLIPSWKRFLHPVRQVQGWIDTNPIGDGASGEETKDNLFSYRHMPTFVYVSPNWPEPLYGVPCDDADDHADDSLPYRHWLKVGIHKQDVSKAFFFQDHPPMALSSEVQELEAAVPHCINECAWALKGAKSPCLIETKPCLYTMTPDKHFVIGESAPNVFVVGGLSGHGYKMTPALGQIMADYAFGKDVATIWQTSFCSPNRFSFGSV